jgi:hypothetical protein
MNAACQERRDKSTKARQSYKRNNDITGLTTVGVESTLKSEENFSRKE